MCRLLGVHIINGQAGELIGVTLLDFVIVADPLAGPATDPAEGPRYHSFRESGVLA